jgi:hypothetical protein
LYRDSAADIYFTLQALMRMLEFDSQRSELSNRRLSDFGNLFRMVV